MREDLEQILTRFQYEINSERTRREIKHMIESYLTHQVNEHNITDFKVEDKTTITRFENQDENRVYFQICYQPYRMSEIRLIDIMLGGNSIVVSDFENNVVGKRLVPKLKL